MATFDTFWRLTNATGIAGGPDTADNMGMTPPKFKFNFTVQFIPRISLPYQGNTEMAEMAWQVKSHTRPKPKIIYQPVNFYNFRTNVATNTDYGSATVSFYDDPQNKAHALIERYLSAVSPVYGRNQGEADNLDRFGQGNAASIGPLSSNRHGPIKAIIVTHHYYLNGPKRTTYEYINPKFSDIDLDDLDMSVSEPSMVTMTFNFDTFNVKNS